jgi:hypothetical protein
MKVTIFEDVTLHSDILHVRRRFRRMFLFKFSSSETSTNIASTHGVTSKKTADLINTPLR